jgi:hypothetical protein
MRILTNERRIKRGRFLATSLSVSGILMLLSSWAGVVLPSLAGKVLFDQSIEYSTIPLLLFGVIFSLIGIHFTRKWVRLPLAHVVLASALKGVGKDSVLLNYFGPADHILVTRNGAFLLTTRNQPYDLLIGGNRWVDRAPLRERLQRAFARDLIGTPMRDAKRDADKASRWLSKLLGKEITVQPLIVFLNPKTYLEVTEQPQIPVVYADKRTPTLKSFLKSELPSTLTNDEIEKVLSLSAQSHEQTA